jgi:hypothetical protein
MSHDVITCTASEDIPSQILFSVLTLSSRVVGYSVYVDGNFLLDKIGCDPNFETLLL